MVKHLLLMRRSLYKQEGGGKVMHEEVESARAEVINIVNNFFHKKMTSMPAIKIYIDEVRKKKEG
jgi:hypothetical protein